MRIATWNLNNRVGRVRFRPEAASAATELGADIILFTEYYPKQNGPAFLSTLTDAGYSYQIASWEPPEVSNRALLVSRIPVSASSLARPDFDNQLPANLVAATVDGSGLNILGIRIPAYERHDLHQLEGSWRWLEATAAVWRGKPALIMGDLNVSHASPRQKGGDAYRRILNAGWFRPQPTGAGSYFSHRGTTSEIDHALATDGCQVLSAAYVTRTANFTLAGAPGAISDHAALVVEVTVTQRGSSADSTT